MTPPTTAAAVNPRSIGAEGPYITDDVHQLADLKAELIDNGVSAPEAASVVGWLVDKAAGARDTTTATTRSRYRKLLAELDGPPGSGRGDRGHTETRPALALVLGAGLAVAATRHPPAALTVVQNLAPIIVDSSVMSSEVAA